MAGFKLSAPLNVPLMLLLPRYTNSVGVDVKTYPNIKDGVLTNVTTFPYNNNSATVETWFRPDIKSNCRIGVPQTGAVYDILGEPENIEMRNQYLRLKLIEVKGGA